MQKNVSIDDLPNELLLMVFKRLYKLHREKGKAYFETPPEECWAGDPFDPSMFPHAQAKVCRRWHALLADDPAFWTRVPIAVDSAATPLDTVANYFRLSQDLPIQVFVKRQPNDHSIQDPEEKARVAAILPYITQHLRRIKDIDFSLLHNASIPDLPRWLVGEASIVESISLSHDDQISGPTVLLREDNINDASELELDFSAPELTSLSMDAQTFARACSLSEMWLTSTPKLSRLSLTPSRSLSLVDDLSMATTLEVLSRARELRSLSVRGVNFLEDGEIFQPPPFLSISSMSFEDLRGTAVANFVCGRGGLLEDLVIKNCLVHGLDSFFTPSLILEDLNDECDLTEPFGGLKTLEVWLFNCPAFDDALLDFMANGGSSGEDFPAKGISSLWVKGCTNFQVENLYRMVVARREAMEASPDWDGTIQGLASGHSDELSAITLLQVAGGPFLSDEYRSKFRQLVPLFSWTNAEDDTGDAI